MNKRIRKKKMKQYAKQHGINLNTKIEIPPIPLLEDNRNLIALCYGCTVVPPKPTLQIDHL